MFWAVLASNTLLLCLLVGISVFILYRKASGEILQRKSAESALRKSEERYRMLYHQTPAMLHSIDKEGYLVSVSDYWSEVMGYEKKDVVGKRLTDFFTATSREHAESNIFPQFFKTGYCKDVPYQFIKKNGEIIDVLLSAISDRKEDGLAVRSLAVSIDVTERKRAEGSLQESLRQVEAYSKALKKELEQGRHMQANFLPDRLPRKAGWEFAAFFKPARQVSGDFYDVFELPSGQIGMVIADVCDKGVGAALFMALFRSLIRVFSGQTELKGLKLSGEDSMPDFARPTTKADNSEYHSSALEAVRMTNNYIVQNHDKLSMFATLFFGVLCPDTGLLTYVSGGHEPLFVIDSSGRMKRLTHTGPAVGLIADATFRMEQIHLEPGATLLGYTDGVTDARSSEGSLFGRKQLEMLLNETFSSAGGLIENIKSKLFSFTGDAAQEDDITLLAVQRSTEAIDK